MNTRKVTGLSMIIAPVIAILGWIFIGAVLLQAGPDDPEKFITALGDNNEAVKYLFPLVTILFLIALGGLNRIKNSMEGGSGHLMAGFGFFLVIIGSAAQLGEVAFTLATAEASHGGNMSIASSMLASSQAFGAISTAITMVGIALIGVGILQQKNFTPLVGGLMIITGIFTSAVSLIDYENPIIIIGFVAVVASFVWLGVSLLKQKD